MSIKDIIDAISSVGFPAVVCIGLGWYVKYQTDANNKEVTEMRKEQIEMRREHTEEINKVTEALNNNTLALQKLCDKIERGN